jgi:hypothetical protein
MCCIAQSDVGVIKTRLIVHLIAHRESKKRAKLKLKLKLSKALKSGSTQRSNKGKVNS